MGQSECVETLYGVVARQAKTQPEKDAVVANGTIVKYRDLLGHVEALRATFSRAGVNSGEHRVCLADLGKLDLLTGVIATIGCGATAVVASSGDQYILNDCDPTVLFTDKPELYETVSSPVIVTPHVEEVPYRSGIECADARCETPALIMYTSGTTSGTRKGAILTHGMLATTTSYMNEVMTLDDSVREYVMSPLEHSFGFARCRAVFHAGGTVVVDDGLSNPARVLLAVGKYRCNAISSVSSGFAILLRRFREELAKIGPQIRWCEIGSVPLSVELKRLMLSAMPSASIFMHYGLTEASRSTLLNLRENPSKLESVGKASPGVEVRVGEDGEVLVRGPNVTPGYWQRPREWGERFRDGWLHTGDLGRMDDDGFLYILGRKDDVINVGGQKILPEPIENALSPLISGGPFCVVGIPDPDGLLGEVPVLVIEGSSVPTVQEVRRCLRDSFPEHAIPRRVFRFDSFPRTLNGKIRRSAIRQEIASMGVFDQ
jgi:acyl-CoA synthetase (AMP-forming)/AMP-acid ligase II